MNNSHSIFSEGVLLGEDFKEIETFSEDVLNLIYLNSNDKLQRLMAVEIARLNSFKLAEPPDEIKA